MKKLIEGKTKIIFDLGDGICHMVAKDDITAGDGDKHDVISGKAELATRTTANVFELLNRKGIPTHFMERVDPTALRIRCCKMIPLEVVVRGTATGSFLKRNPQAREGQELTPPLPVEFFLKDDARHDPIITFGSDRWYLHPPKEPVTQHNVIEELEPMLSADEIEYMRKEARRVFDVLKKAWAKLEVRLVDLKIEYGRTDEGSLLVADVIDNDSWRIWPQGEKKKQLDKQVYREGGNLEDTLSRYKAVADLTDRFSKL